MTYAYIASPYSHPDPEIRAERYQAVLKVTASLLASRRWCYSPIVHCHDLALTHDLPKDAEYWRAYNEAMLTSAQFLLALRLDGWQASRGMIYEIAFAKRLDIPVGYIDPLP